MPATAVRHSGIIPDEPEVLGDHKKRTIHEGEGSELLLTVGELAKRLRVNRSWVYQHAGALGAYRLGKYLRFSWQRVLERIESGIG